MMIGELEYDDVMYPQGDNGETQLQYYPVSAYSLMFAFIVLFSIIIMNLLFGLAVSDVQVRNIYHFKALNRKTLLFLRDILIIHYL